MAYPDINQVKVEAIDAISILKSIINNAKNVIAPESTEVEKLTAFKNDTSSTELEKKQMTDAICALKNIYNAIIAEGF